MGYKKADCENTFLFFVMNNGGASISQQLPEGYKITPFLINVIKDVKNNRRDFAFAFTFNSGDLNPRTGVPFVSDNVTLSNEELDDACVAVAACYNAYFGLD